MKQFLIILIILLINILNLHGQWEILNEGIKGWLSSVDFINENTGWIVGTEGMFLKTGDGGLTWIPIPIKEELSINNIDFLNTMNGWATGEVSDTEGTAIFKTEDGGYNWNVKRQQNNEWFNKLQALNDSVVIVSSDIKTIKTTNGGADWIEITPELNGGYIHSVRFIDEERGLVSGIMEDSSTWQGFISKTYTGGSSWENTLLPDFDEIYDLQFTSDSVGYFKAWNWETETAYFLCRTEDVIQNWVVLFRSNYLIDSYFLMNDEIIYLSVFDSLNNMNLLKSGDNGKNWDNIFSLTNWNVAFVKLNEEDKGLIICYLSGMFGGGSNPLILSNQFDHKNWLANRFSYPLSDIFFFDQNRGFTVGGYEIFHGPTGGDVFLTNDGGFTWSPDNSLHGWINSIEFANESIGYVTTQNWPWLIYKTTDSGINWSMVYENNFDSTGFEFFGNDMFLSSGEEVWAVGNYYAEYSGGAGILNTVDGGITWNLIWTHLNTESTWYNLHSVHIVDDVLWSVGDQGFIARIVDKDSFQITTYPTDLPLKEVFFSDAMHGWIAGGYGYWEDFQPLLLKTSDGGITWIEQEDFPYIVKELFFRDSLQGWAVGFDSNQEGVIVATNNGGESWDLQTDKLPAPLNAIHFIGDYGWVVGEMGQILMTEDGGASWINDDNHPVQATSFRLEQNYPNPFNPRTIINYELTITNEVELSIYNLLGQKVKTLVSQEQPAGYYKIEWDASDYASGIYIYRLRAKSKTQSMVKTRKLVLLK
jgi:photosystem II stability/assembly factor-like uncharacterized protein